MARWRLVALALAVACAAGSARAAGGIDKLAILSNLGGRLTVVVFKQGVGSRLDRNPRLFVDLPADAFDAEAGDAMARAVRELPRSTPIPVLLPTLDADARQAAFADGQPLPGEALRQLLRQAGATHLLLLARHRAESRLRLADGAVGSGTLEGLGFYLDRATPTRVTETGASGRGFLAPYAYLSLSLVDLATGTVLAQQSGRASTTVSAGRLTAGNDPWEVLTPEDKVLALRQLIHTELRRLVPELLAGR